MIEPRCDLDLTQEALGTEHRRQLGAQHFDGDGAVVLDVVREVDGRHSAAAQLAPDSVATRERRLEARIGTGHHTLPGSPVQLDQISLNSFSIAAHDPRSAAASYASWGMPYLPASGLVNPCLAPG